MPGGLASAMTLALTAGPKPHEKVDVSTLGTIVATQGNGKCQDEAETCGCEACETLTGSATAFERGTNLQTPH